MTQQVSAEQALAIQKDIMAALESQRNAALNQAAQMQAYADGNARIANALQVKVNELQTKLDELSKPAATPIEDAATEVSALGGEQP